MAEMREFETGATRNADANKHDIEGFLSPLVLERYFAYMHKHRFQADGKVRDSDNWQKGIPKEAYMKSGWRHFFDWWKEHRELSTLEGIEEALCALLFNAMGYLHEHLKSEVEKASRHQRVLPWGGEVLIDRQFPGSLITPTAHADGFSVEERPVDGARHGQPCSCGSTRIRFTNRDGQTGVEERCAKCGRGR